MNKQNCHVCRREHPQRVYKFPQSAPLVSVWCVVSEIEVIGPYFFDKESSTWESYKSMLRNFAF